MIQKSDANDLDEACLANALTDLGIHPAQMPVPLAGLNEIVRVAMAWDRFDIPSAIVHSRRAACAGFELP
ncbi:MAG: hypothetical protein AAGL24_03765 [Pseudomonadota bacterium]